MLNPKTDSSVQAIQWKQFRQNPTKFWQNTTFLIASAAVLFGVLWARISEMPPKVLGDELLYSLNARKFELAEIDANFLYAIIFRSTNVCGPNYYGCAKTLNIFFLLALAIVLYFFIRRVTNPRNSYIVSLLAVLGPLGLYASWFMPESMYYFGAVLVIYFLTKFNGSTPYFYWPLIGLGIGLLTLVKPHALFFVGAVFVYALYLFVSFRSNKLKIVFGFIATTVVVISTKLTLGYVLAGEKGVSLFSQGYDSAGTHITGGGIDAPAQAVDSDVLGSALGETISIFGIQLLLVLGFVLTVSAVPVYNLLTSAKEDLTSKSEPDLAQRSKTGVLLITIVFAGVAIAFSTFSHAWGETLEDRIMIRFMEFCFPLLFIGAFADEANAKLAKKFKVSLLVLAALTLAAGIFLQIYVEPQIMDAALLYPFSQTFIPGIVVALSTVAAILVGIKNPKKASRVWLYVSAPLVAILFSITSVAGVTLPSAQYGYYKMAGQYGSTQISPENRKYIYVVGNAIPNVKQTLFWIDEPSIQGTAVPPGGEFDLQTAPDYAKVVLVVGQLSVKGKGKIAYESPGDEAGFAVILVPSKTETAAPDEAQQSSTAE